MIIDLAVVKRQREQPPVLLLVSEGVDSVYTETESALCA